MSECADLTFYQRNRDVILNRTKDYYETEKERLRGKQKINRETYLKKKKIKRENMEKNKYRNMFEEKKKRLKEYQKFEAKRSEYNNE